MIDLQRAPIRYEDIRLQYQTMRVAVSVSVAIVMAAAAWFGLWWGGTIAIAAFALAGDGWRRRHAGSSISPTVYLDMTLIGVGIILSGVAHPGHSHAAQAAGTAAVITAAVLVMPIGKSLLAVGYAVFWNAMILILGNRVELVDALRADTVVMIEQIVTGIFLATTAVILYGAARSLLIGAERTEAALQQERRANELKNEFVSMVSHELRTPLTSISGFIDTLRSAWETLPASEIEEFLGIVADEAGHLSTLVEDVLVIPRLEAGRLPFDIVDFDPRQDFYACIDAIFPAGSTDKHIDVSMPGVVRVRGDRIRARQIVRNLLENARKYGGDEVLIDVRAMEDHIQVVVADNGPGVPETDRHRIFEPFEQVGKGNSREGSGIGLGLPIASHLTSAMGGRMWYEQAFPRGARFCFTLPLAAEMSVAVPDAPAKT